MKMKRSSSCRSLSLLAIAVSILSVLLLLPVLVVFDQHSESTAPCFAAHAFTLAPQPAGFSPNFVADLARKRYGTTEEDAPPMKDKVVVITGAAGGIGCALTNVVHDLGGTVVAMDRNTTGLDSLQKSLGSSRVVTLPTQHEDMASVAKSADDILSRFGGTGIDMLVNNAGLTYPPDAEPGGRRMNSAQGHDLAFTVNYLSHFLLVEKLLPCLSAPHCRVVHLTSTYHWKVDGSEIIPNSSEGPIAYQSDPAKQGPKHIERSYANTKLAQIWHSRSIRGCESVCACPTWVGTGIGGEGARDFLERFAFPVNGAGIASALNAMLRSSEELGDALNDGQSLVANSRILEYLPLKNLWTSEWVTKQGWRDSIVDFGGLILLLGQRFTFEEFLVQKSSPESFNNKEWRDALYQWSLDEVRPWL